MREKGLIHLSEAHEDWKTAEFHGKNDEYMVVMLASETSISFLNIRRIMDHGV